MSDPEKWIVREMKIDLSSEQVLKAILAVSNINLGEAKVYLSNIEMSETGEDWTFKLLGSE